MTSEEPTPAAEPTPVPEPAPRPRRQGCVIALLVLVLLLLGGCLTVWLKKGDIGVYLVRKGIAAQPWAQETRDRASRIVDRYVQARDEGRISEEDTRAMAPILEEFKEANREDGISEEEALPLLEKWEAWLEEAEKEP